MCSSDYADQYITCDFGTYLSDRKCIKCSDPVCFNCNKNDYCIQYPDTYAIVDGKCVKCTDENCHKCKQQSICDECEPGYTTSLGKCIRCEDLNCTVCGNEGKECNSCLPGFGLHLISNSANYGTCLQCKVENCSKCDGNVSICTEYKENFYFFYNQCLENPPLIEEVIYPGDKDDSLPTWAIVLIVIGCVIVVGVVIFLIVYFCKKKKVGVESHSA